MNKITTLLTHWFHGVRIYIGIATVLISLEVWWWGIISFGSGNLATIRIQEVFAWLSIVYLSVTLLIGPTMKAIARFPGKAYIWDARRALGISAAWFALLHTLVVYIKQLKAPNPFELPTTYLQAALLGATALLILIILASTSVNAIMRKWGIWWFRVHRLIYVAVLLALIHSFMVGAHASSYLFLIILTAIALIWTGLHVYLLLRSNQPGFRQVLTVTLGTLLLLSTLTFGLTQHYNQARTAAEAAEHNH